MTSFGWKRKISLAKSSKATAFKEEEQSQDPDLNPSFDWIAECKKRKFDALEDNKIRFERLKTEGSLLAEQGRFWEAILRWNDALEIDGNDVGLLDMKAQSLIHLHEWIPAIQSCQQAIKVKRNWWPAYQTLGRAQLGLGEVQLARRNFQISFHLNPAELEIWTEDIVWTEHLLKQADRVAKPKLESGGENGEVVEPIERIKPDSVLVAVRR